MDQETVIENDTEYEPEINDLNDRDKNELETLILTVESGENKVGVFIPQMEKKIGRAHDNDIVIDLKLYWLSLQNFSRKRAVYTN